MICKHFLFQIRLNIFIRINSSFGYQFLQKFDCLKTYKCIISYCNFKIYCRNGEINYLNKYKIYNTYIVYSICISG